MSPCEPGLSHRASAGLCRSFCSPSANLAKQNSPFAAWDLLPLVAHSITEFSIASVSRLVTIRPVWISSPAGIIGNYAKAKAAKKERVMNSIGMALRSSGPLKGNVRDTLGNDHY